MNLRYCISFQQFLFGLAPNFFHVIVELVNADSHNGMISKTQLHFETVMMKGY